MKPFIAALQVGLPDVLPRGAQRAGAQERADEGPDGGDQSPVGGAGRRGEAAILGYRGAAHGAVQQPTGGVQGGELLRTSFKFLKEHSFYACARNELPAGRTFLIVRKFSKSTGGDLFR